MVYISFWFYIFVAILLLVYYLLPIKIRWISLLIGSLGFYWYISQYSKRRFFTLIVLAFISWLLSIIMTQHSQYKNALLIISLVTDIAPLLIIKEAPLLSWRIDSNMIRWILVPVGISFFSLQLISYSVDVYKGLMEPERNILKFLLFISFFPQIVQGPIPRYSQLSHQLIRGHHFDEKNFVKGFMLILWGFFLKLCVADKAGIVVDRVFDNYPTYRGMYVLVGGILYSIQLYADFSSCSTLAQGIAGLFGIDLISNFERPYFATSIKDFWRRWHISLSSWLRDYIYIPLGGSKSGAVRKYINILITFAISGIWHGSGYKYIFWGLLHGFYLVVSNATLSSRNVLTKKLQGKIGDGILATSRMIGTFVLVMFGWIIFRAEYLKTGLSMIKSIFTVHNPWIFTNDSLFDLGLDWKEFYVLIICMIILFLVSLAQEKRVSIRDCIINCNIVVRWAIYIIAIIFIMIFGTYGWGYDPQAFIYGGF